jgi:capsular polysaccharide biosynthesis protein
MELVDYVRLVRKWLWLFIIAALVAGGVAYVVSSSRPDVYRAETMLSVGGFIQSPNPDAYDFIAGENLAENYAILAQTFEVLQATVQSGGFPLDPEELGGMVDTRIIANTSMLVLSVEYTDPVLAADIANELAQQLILNSPTNLTAAQQSQLDLATAEIEKLSVQLQDTRAQLQLLDAQIAAAQTDNERDLLQARHPAIWPDFRPRWRPCSNAPTRWISSSVRGFPARRAG